MQFLNTETHNFFDDFMSFNELLKFYTEIGKFRMTYVFAVSGYPIKTVKQ